MEIYIFMIEIGLWLAGCFVMLGVIIGELNAKRPDKKSLFRDSSYPVLPCGDTDMCNSDMGNGNREKPNRRDMGEGCYQNGQITEGCTPAALREIRRSMKTMLSQTEIDALDKKIAEMEVDGE